MWKCPQDNCFDCFENITGLLQHGASHGRKSYVKNPSGSKQQFICSICKETSDTLDQLMGHTGTHPENKYHCDECSWHFNFIHALAIHGQDCHNTRHHSCQWCPKYFNTAEELLQHIHSNHHFECTSCYVSFPTADELKEHEVVKHGGAQPSEEEQLLLRRREQKLKAQQDKERREKAREQAATQEKYFSCTQCLKGFGSQKDLGDHTTREHVFVCGECYKIFISAMERD